MQTISRYVYHDTISLFPLYVDIFITAILIYDITDFIFIFTVQLQVFICMFYVLSCTGILINIFISLNNGITFFLEGEKHDLIRLPSQECFEYYHSQHQKDIHF